MTTDIGTISPDVARAAVALRNSHSHAPAMDVLEAVMRQRSGCLADFGPGACDADQPFGAIICEAFDRVMVPAEWAGLLKQAADRDALLEVWRTHVLPRFVARYGLA